MARLRHTRKSQVAENIPRLSADYVVRTAICSPHTAYLVPFAAISDRCIPVPPRASLHTRKPAIRSCFPPSSPNISYPLPPIPPSQELDHDHDLYLEPIVLPRTRRWIPITRTRSYTRRCGAKTHCSPNFPLTLINEFLLTL